MPINAWPIAERPREKLLDKGAQALSDAELLAIFLRTGVQGCSAVDLARSLLQDFGSLRSLMGANQEEFCAGHGLGLAKYTQLQAVLEMSQRYLAEELKSKRVDFASSAEVKAYLTSKLRDRHAECFAVLYLNSQHHLLRYQELFTGTIDSANVYPREVVKDAMRHNAAAVILAHNHPSGLAEPSDADRFITDRIKQALELVDIRTLDHMVVGDGQIVSFAERGWL